MKRWLTALGIGLAIETLVIVPYFWYRSVVGATVAGSASNPVRWIVQFSQEPALHLVEWLVDILRPGFEEQVGYVFLIPVFQWLFYSAGIYPLVGYYRRKRTSRHAIKA
jgi:hypothetical protein